MLVFVDESGDPGMKLEGGSTPYFTVALVIFEDYEEATACDLRIGLLRRELSLPTDFEFHFHDNHPTLRKTFLTTVAPYDFFYFGIVLDKSLLTGPGFRFRNSFYKYASRLVFENAKPYLKDAIAVFDESGSATFKMQLARYLRRQINQRDSPGLIRKVKVQPSGKNNLLQLADMIAGALGRTCLVGKVDQWEYWKLIRHREIYVQRWPKKERPEA